MDPEQSPIQTSLPDLAQVRPGIALMVEIEGELGQHRSILMGMIPGEYLVITLPEISSALWLINAGVSLVGRLLDKGVIYGFRSRVIGKYVKEQVRLAFLAWPEEVETHHLRRQQRLESYFPASLQYGQSRWEGVVTNLSQGGFQFQGGPEENQESPLIGSGEEVSVECRMVGLSGTHQVVCQVRNLRQEGGNMVAGLSFSQDEGPLPRVIAAYVQEVQRLLQESVDLVDDSSDLDE